jgi:hypothetical protein
MTNLRALESRRAEVLERIRSLGDMRRGTLTERFLPCGKPGCHCTRPESRGHGPKYSLTWKLRGKTKTEYIPKARVPQVRLQTETHRKFLELAKDLVEVNEAICRLRSEEGSPAGAKKKSVRRSKRNSPKRSTGS